jgi:hypothetical protein
MQRELTRIRVDTLGYSVFLAKNSTSQSWSRAQTGPCIRLDQDYQAESKCACTAGLENFDVNQV